MNMPVHPTGNYENFPIFFKYFSNEPVLPFCMSGRIISLPEQKRKWQQYIQSLLYFKKIYVKGSNL